MTSLARGGEQPLPTSGAARRGEGEGRTPTTLARAASVIGREHVRLGRNNQDGFSVCQSGDVTVAVVTDGCSSQPSSEVGARLGARFLATWVADRAHARGVTASLVTDATDALVAWLYGLARGLDARPDGFSAVVADHLLFTFLCAVARDGRALVFGLGDGVVLVDGEVLCLDAGADNAPPYAAYRLVGGQLEPQLHLIGAAERVVVATDGLTSLSRRTPATLRALADEPACWKNPVALQRRLNVLAEAERFSDDATLAVLRTRGEGS